MPIPPASFTKTKWLTFFAELSAKVTHHNVLVVLEGCEVIRRVLVSRVSVAAFLEEGNLLQHLLDTIEGEVSGRTVTNALDVELLFVQLQTLSLCIDMMVSLYADGDEYYCLLVLARAGVLVDALTRMVQCVHPYFYGIFCGLMQSLLTLPLGKPIEVSFPAGMAASAMSAAHSTAIAIDRDKPQLVDLDTHPRSSAATPPPPVALSRHLNQLHASVRGQVALLQHVQTILMGLVAALDADPPKKLAASALLGSVTWRVKRSSTYLNGQSVSTQPAPKGQLPLNRSRGTTTTSAAAGAGAESPASPVRDGLGSSVGLIGLPSRLETPRAKQFGENSVGLRSTPGKAVGLNCSAANFGTDARPANRGSDTPRNQSENAALFNEISVLDCSDITCESSAGTRYLTEDVMRRERDALDDVFQWELDMDSSDDEPDGDAVTEAGAASSVRVTGGDGETGCTVRPEEGKPTSGHVHGGRGPHGGRPGSIQRLFRRIGDSGSHEEFFAAMNDLWCVTLAAGRKVCAAFHVEELEAFYRFLETPPTNRHDSVLFTYILLWLARMMSLYQVADDVRDALLSEPSEALIAYLGAELQKRDMQLLTEPGGAGHDAAVGERGVDTAARYLAAPRGLTAATTVEVHRGRVAPALERPSVAFILLSFLLNAERACTSSHIERWVRSAGLLGKLDAIIRRVENVRSALIDAPTTMDGALSDEVYLGCALTSTKNEDTVLAVLACKLLSCIVLDHHEVLDRLLAPETSTMLQTLIPLLLKISIQNPTLTSATENVSASALHHMPYCQRSSRYTSLGECSVVALDSCLWLTSSMQFNCVHLADVISTLPAISRSTRRSIHPPLRATVYRCLTRLCTTPAHLVLVVREMPSIINVAVASVLEYHTGSPQWESAAAAEWIAHVIRIASTDANVERSFNFAQTALPVKLLQLAALNGISYCTAALVSLATALFEQQQRFAEAYNERSSSVLLPLGKRSIETWLQLLRLGTSANQRLAYICQHVTPTATTAKDALSRAQTTLEELSVQFSFLSSLARSVRFLVITHPEYRGCVPHGTFYALLDSVLAVPSPEELCRLVSTRFSVSIRRSTVVSNTYEEMVRWTMELSAVWFTSSHGEEASQQRLSSYPPLPESVYRSACRVMKEASISQATRCHLTLLLCSVLALQPTCVTHAASSAELKQQECLRQGIESYSGHLFEASLLLQDVSCVHGLRARLVASFTPANRKAHSTGWLAARVVELDKLMRRLQEAMGLLDTHASEALAVSISQVASTLMNAECTVVAPEVRRLISQSLLIGLQFSGTQLLCLRVLKSLSESPEGRRVLLDEVSTTGDPARRTCFGRVIQLTFFASGRSVGQAPFSTLTTSVAPGPPNAAAGAGSASARSNGHGASSVEREAARAAVLQLGIDICSAACAKGGEAFAHMIVKFKAVDAAEQLFVQYDRQRPPSTPAFTSAAFPHSTASSGGPIPLALCRFVAALSFSSGVQPVIMQHQELFSILVETAGEANERGTLALLAVRNLCFNAPLKTRLCQDSRVLLALKAGLMALPSVELLARNMAGSNPAFSEASSGEDLLAAFEAYRQAQCRVQSQSKCSSATYPITPPLDEDAPGSGYTGTTAVSLNQFLQRHHSQQKGIAPKPSDTALRPRHHSETIPSEAELLRRQELSVSALWALMHDHERGKAYIRGLLNQAPSVHIGNAMILPLYSTGPTGSVDASETSLRRVPHANTTDRHVAVSAGPTDRPCGSWGLEVASSRRKAEREMCAGPTAPDAPPLFSRYQELMAEGISHLNVLRGVTS